LGILDNFEKGLERVVNGAFAKTFKSGLQPLEVTAALRRELTRRRRSSRATASWFPTASRCASRPATTSA
jgi:hypothetical protein